MGNGTEVPEEMPGTYIEMLRLVAQDLPIDLKLERYPWERCKANLRNNRVDAINSSYRESRAEIGVFPRTDDGSVDVSRRITDDTYRLYTLDNSMTRFDAKAQKFVFADRGISAPLGYSIVGDLRAAGNTIEENAGGVMSLMRMLAYNRISGVIAHDSQASFVLERNQELLKHVIATEPALAKKPYYILISKAFYQKHPKLSEAIWNKLQELREDELPKILKKYYKN